MCLSGVQRWSDHIPSLFSAELVTRISGLIRPWANRPHERLCYPSAAWFAAVLLIASSSIPAMAQDLRMPISPIWGVPEVGALPDDAHGRFVRRGRDLVTATYAHIGPEVANPANRYAGNN